MNDHSEIDQLSRALKSEVRRRLRSSVLVSGAVLTLAAAWLFLEIRSDQRLEEDRRALTKEVQRTEEIAKQAIKSPVDTNLPLPTALQQALRETQGSIPFAVRAVNNPDGYFVILGSYRKLADAVSALPQLRRSTNEPVRLFWAVNDYFATVVGVLATREEALAKQRGLRSVVSDAYLFGAWAFPYELVERK